MRIIAGSARGQKFEAPEGMNTRPVTDKIRESLFNIWQWDISESAFLDLFSGSGSMGLEALSRGAGNVTMVEMGKNAFETIESNLDHLNVDKKKATRLNMDVMKALDLLKSQGKTFDIIYADPPYTQNELYTPLMDSLKDGSLLNEGGSIAIRAEKNFKMPETEGLELVREKKYGISKVYFYRPV